MRPGPLGGDRRSGRIEQQEEVILGLLEGKPDITLAEIVAALAERGVSVSSASIWRVLRPSQDHAQKSRRTRTSRAAPTL